MAAHIRSPYRWPICLWRDYLRPSHYFYVLKHWYQRARRGYSDSDLWNFDNHLTRMLAEALPTFRSDGGSHVAFLTKEDQARSWEEGFDLDEALPRGDAILDEILEGLAIQLDYGRYPSEDDQQKIDRAWQLVAEYVQSFWL